MKVNCFWELNEIELDLTDKTDDSRFKHPSRVLLTRDEAEELSRKLADAVTVYDELEEGVKEAAE